MKAFPKIILIVLVLTGLFLFLYHTELQAHLPRDVENALVNANDFTLFSLNPDPDFEHASTNTFQNHDILGQLDVKSAGTRKELVAALNEGISAEDRRLGAGARQLPACFNPRHGIRAKKGDETVELLICFECSQIYVTSPSAHNQLFMTTSDPANVFNGVLKDAGIPLPSD